MDEKNDPRIESLKDKIIKIFAAVGLLAVLFGIGMGCFKAIPLAGKVAGSAAVFLSSQFFPSGDENSTEENGGEETSKDDTIQRIYSATSLGGIPVAKTEPATTAIPSFIDLSARVVKTGVVDMAGQFIATSSIRFGERAAVQFEIINFGNIPSGTWTFNAVLPTIPNHIFGSDTQTSLRPRDKALYTLGFDNIRDI